MSHQLFTRYGSQVQIVQACLTYASSGAILVQAQVAAAGRHAPVNSEIDGQNVNATDPFARGWIPVNQLISEGGPEDVLDQALDAPTGTPSNLDSLLRLYWPGLFGFLTVKDVINKTGIMATTMQRFRPEGIFNAGATRAG